jgi:hypothetical protein
VERTVFNDAVATERYLPAAILQAEGALSARLDVDIREAAETLRAIARDTGTPLVDVARQVLAGRPPAD